MCVPSTRWGASNYKMTIYVWQFRVALILSAECVGLAMRRAQESAHLARLSGDVVTPNDAIPL